MNANAFRDEVRAAAVRALIGEADDDGFETPVKRPSGPSNPERSVSSFGTGFFGEGFGPEDSPLADDFLNDSQENVAQENANITEIRDDTSIIALK